MEKLENYRKILVSDLFNSIDHVTKQEIKNIIKIIDICKVARAGEISNEGTEVFSILFKKHRNANVHSNCHTKKSIFSNLLKIINITMLHKSSKNIKLPPSYRPSSSLSSLDKIIESIICFKIESIA